MEREPHWESIYRGRRAEQLSWYRPHLEVSLRLIEEALPDKGGRIVDVGGGASTLADDLLAREYRNVAVLELSSAALQVAQQRLGTRAAEVGWLHGDVTTYPFEPSCFDLWHDRAVFHFLTSPAERAAYVRQAARAVKLGGHVIVATFGPQGPTRCSGLEVVRYSATALHAALGANFTLVKEHLEMHRTPGGAEQQFVYCLLRLTTRPSALAP